MPDTLKDSKGGAVKVTSVIKDAHGNVETNGQLAPGVHIVTFSADGYEDVTAGVSVTNHS
ncbi:Phage protein [Leuconostoc pseudomesenteroides 1159]|nr:Phage protein [Leuconostoc pseudomesenteroides 1159]